MYIIRASAFQKGQTLLMVILVMVVALTIGLSVATRSLTNTRLSTEAENSKRAFSAAEAGVQEALKSNVLPGTPLPPGSLGNNAQFKDVTMNTVSGTSFLINNGAIVPQDDGADVWLVPHNPDGTPSTTPLGGPATTIALFFGNTGKASCTDVANESAIELVVVSGASFATATSKHYVFDPCAARSTVNHMTIGSQAMGEAGAPTTNGQYGWPVNNPTSGAVVYMDYEVWISVTNGYFIRVIPLYANSVISVASSLALPSQGSSITSTGVYASVQRKITAFRSFAKVPPEFFPNIIFSSQ